MRSFTLKKLLLTFKILIGVFVLLFIPQNALSWGKVNISSNISVSPTYLPFKTVFPEEVLYKPVTVSLSRSCLNDKKIKDVEYQIKQKIKPRAKHDALYCKNNPADYSRCYPTLCPYLSKEADQSPPNDTSVEAFHDPNAPTSIAYGKLGKSEKDFEDKWTIDLHVPCFRGQCAQDNVVPKEYELDPALESQVFGCDLEFIVDKIGSSKGTISGIKFNDINRNKKKDFWEPGLSGWTIRLKDQGNKTIQTTLTGSDGKYTFTNLSEGKYKIREVRQKGWKRMTKNPKPITIKSGDEVKDINFGNAKKKNHEKEDTDWDDDRDD